MPNRRCGSRELEWNRRNGCRCGRPGCRGSVRIGPATAMPTRLPRACTVGSEKAGLARWARLLMRGTDSGGPVAARRVASVVAPPPSMCCLRSTIDAGSRGRSRTGFAMSMLSENSEGPPAASCRDGRSKRIRLGHDPAARVGVTATPAGDSAGACRPALLAAGYRRAIRLIVFGPAVGQTATTSIRSSSPWKLLALRV